MTKTINLKTHSLYMGYFDDENESAVHWLHFVYASDASDEELEKHFREVVYKDEYGVEPDEDQRVDVYELRSARDYATEKAYKITVSPS